jgi:anti-sigma factor RsiW
LSDSCIDPAEIQEGDLMAYVDGTAGEAVVRHVHRCPTCARRAKELARLQATLAINLYRHSCPEPDRLIAYRQDELGGNEKLIVIQHLRQCPHCARELADLAREERAGLGERFREAVEVLEAALVTPQAQVAAVRDGPGTARPKQQVYRAAEVEIIVSLRPVWGQPGKWDLSGLVHIGGQVPETIGGAKVELYRGEGSIAITMVSARGHFGLTNVDPAEYDLALFWEGRDIRLKGVRVE